MSFMIGSTHGLQSSGRHGLRPFLVQEYLRIMRSRLALLIWAILVYTLAAVPFLMAKPPPELLGFIEGWLGSEAVHAKLLLFMWVDAAMNKLAVVLGPALAGGIIVEERARGTLDLLAAKPIAAQDYYTIKLAAAAAALATFYVAAAVAAVLTFPWRVVGFDVLAFAALSLVHLFAALFSVTFAGAMATFFSRRLTSMLVSVAILGFLVGIAFLGFYYPAYRTVSFFNPFFDGIVLIGSIERLRVHDILFPIFLLMGFNLGFWLVGRHRAGLLLQGD
jgi:ABC-2 type transport system permease protein